jgi:hypothetical protein
VGRSTLVAIALIAALLAGSTFAIGSPVLPREASSQVPAAGPLLPTIVTTTTNGSVPLDVSFAGSATGGWPPYVFLWSFGDGSPTASGSSASHTFSWVATFVVNLTVSDTNSQTATVSVLIHATPPPLTVAVSSVPAVVQVGNTTYLESSVQGGTPPYVYRWSGLPAGCVALPVENLSCSPTAGGTFQVNLTVTDAAGLTAHNSSLLLVTGGTSGNARSGSPVSSEWWVLGGVGVLVAVLGTAGLWARRRRRTR